MRVSLLTGEIPGNHPPYYFLPTGRGTVFTAVLWIWRYSTYPRINLPLPLRPSTVDKWRLAIHSFSVSYLSGLARCAYAWGGERSPLARCQCMIVETMFGPSYLASWWVFSIARLNGVFMYDIIMILARERNVIPYCTPPPGSPMRWGTKFRFLIRFAMY